MIKNNLTFTLSIVTIAICLGVIFSAIPLALAGGGGGSSSGGSSSSGCNSCVNGGTYATTDSRPTANQISRNLNSNPNSMGSNMESVVTSNSNGTVSVSIRERETGGNENSSTGIPKPGGPVVTPPIVSGAATGYFDSVNPNTCTVTGWAYDPDNAAASISVQVYRDGIFGVGNFVTFCQANQPRPDVNAIIRIPGNHGFNCALPASFRNTGSHVLYIHAIDINGIPNNLLRTNGKTINCNSAITPPPGGPGGPGGPSGPGGPITVTPTPPLTPGTISVTAQSAVVRKLDTTNVRWQISNPIPVGYTCTLNGPGLINIPITTQSGSRQTQPIDSTSIFTVRCTNGTTPVSGEAMVEIIPQVQEV